MKKYPEYPASYVQTFTQGEEPGTTVFEWSKLLRCKDCLYLGHVDDEPFCKHPSGLHSIDVNSFCSFAYPREEGKK